MPQRKLQKPVPTPIVTYEKPFPERPFQPEPIPIATRQVEAELRQITPTRPAPTIRPPEPTAVEEQYEPSERYTLSTTTTDTYYDIIEPNPKAILIMAYDQDHYVELNRPTDENSTLLKADGSLTITGKGTRRIYAKTTTGTGRLHIRIFKR
jgi:hypothetical protein